MPLTLYALLIRKRLKELQCIRLQHALKKSNKWFLQNLELVTKFIKSLFIRDISPLFLALTKVRGERERGVVRNTTFLREAREHFPHWGLPGRTHLSSNG
jgi:hypothetical protein